ncbi:MAG: hypothetical protein ABJE95_09875 [Byssovorax sp.]
MSKEKRLVDFDVGDSTTGRVNDEGVNNVVLFATYEPIRLWLKERVIKAPFRKLAVSFANVATSARWDGQVVNLFGVCEVTEAVDPATLRQNVGDLRWVLGCVRHALGRVAESTGWRSDELEAFLAETSERPWPLVHFFGRLARVDRISGVKCVPWLSVRPGETQSGVRFVSRDNVERDVTLVSRPRPFYYPVDPFNIVKSAIRGRDFVLLDEVKNVLASAPIDSPAPH